MAGPQVWADLHFTKNPFRAKRLQRHDMTLKDELRFIDLTARMALRADASTLVLGYLWWILEPLLFVAIFYLVFAIILDSQRADILSFLIVGKLPFQWFGGGLNLAAMSIFSSQSLISNTHVPKALLVFSKIQQGTYKQLAVFTLMAIYLLSVGSHPSWGWFWVIPIAVAQYFVILACALVGAVMVCFAKDFAKLIQMFVIFMMFSSGIFWDVRALEPELQALIFNFNPLAFLLDSYRQVLLYHGDIDLVRLALIASFFSGLCALVMLWIRRNETKLALLVLSK